MSACTRCLGQLDRLRAMDNGNMASGMRRISVTSRRKQANARLLHPAQWDDPWATSGDQLRAKYNTKMAGSVQDFNKPKTFRR